MTFADLCSKLFPKTQGILDKSNDTVQFKFQNKELDSKSNDTLASLGIGNNSNIDVTWTPSFDRGRLIEESIERQEKMIKENQQKDPVRDTLIDMATLAIEMQEKIARGNLEGRFISADQALKQKNSDMHLFSLGLLAKYLEKLGIKTEIEKGYGQNDKKSLDFANILLQFLVNGMINYRKYCLKFKLEPKEIDLIAKNKNEKEKYNEYFKSTIVDKFEVENPNDIIVTSYTEGSNIVFLLIPKKNDFVLLKDELMQKLKYEKVNDLQDFSEGPVLDSVILAKNMLDKKGDQNGDKKNYGQGEERGGYSYLPPNGWYRCGVRVFNIYDNGNNDWLSWEYKKKGQWSISYHGVKTKQDDSSKYEKEDDSKHPGNLVSKGVLCYQDPNDMGKNTDVISIPNGEKYQLGFMLRVNPTLIRIPKSKKTYWFLNGTPDEIRPYGILVKKYN